PARDRGETVRRIARGLGEVLITLGLIILLFALYEVYGKTEIVNAHQKTLDQQLTQQWAAPDPTGKSAATPSDPQPLPGDAFARLYLPVLQKHWVIVQGVSLADIEFAPGHYPGTAMPGQIGNFSVAGHRIPSIFWNLQELTKGQQIVVQTQDNWYVYTVVSQEAVLPTAIKVIAPVPDQIGVAPNKAMMTLTTCNPKWADYQRLVVHAVLTKTAPAKDGPPIPLGS
ncbi:MAG TPA: class E sortase, partial [Micromonosporaceae bacterium]